MFGAVSAQAAVTNFFLNPAFLSAPNAVEANGTQLIVKPGTLNALYAGLGTAAGTDSFTYTVRINGVNTTITCTITPGNTAANDLAHTAAVIAGDRVSVLSVQSGTTAEGNIRQRASIGWI